MSGTIRILQIANQPGPLVLFEMPICQALRQAGTEVELACMKFGALADRLAKTDFPLHWLTAGSWSRPQTWWRIYRQVRSLLRRGRYDLMVVHTPVMSWIARYAARDCVPTVMYMAHGLPFAPPQGRLIRWALRRVEQFVGRRYTDAVIVMNQADAEACRRYKLTRSGGRCFKVPGVGIDTEAWSAPLGPQQRRKLNAEFGLSADRPVVLYLGRFISAKRPGDILELARRTGPKVDYILAGEGPLQPRIRRRAEGIGPHVRVPGWTDRAKELVQLCTLVAFPSVFREGLPRFLLEAQAAGKPVVAYDVRGSCDAIEHNRTGLLVPPADVNGFCEAAERLLNDEDLRRRMGQAGQERVRRTFSLEAAVETQMTSIRWALAKAGKPLPGD